MPWTDISKPTGSSYTNENKGDDVFFDDPDVTFDSPTTFFDGISTSLYTNVAKPTSSVYTSIAKPT